MKNEFKDSIDSSVQVALVSFKNSINQMEVLCSDVRVPHDLRNPEKEVVDENIVDIKEEETF